MSEWANSEMNLTMTCDDDFGASKNYYYSAPNAAVVSSNRTGYLLPLVAGCLALQLLALVVRQVDFDCFDLKIAAAVVVVVEFDVEWRRQLQPIANVDLIVAAVLVGFDLTCCWAMSSLSLTTAKRENETMMIVMVEFASNR